jgi:hypothetical protein
MAGPFKKLASMALSDDEQIDWLKDRGMFGHAPAADEPPEYPPGLCFTVREADFENLGISGAKGGDEVRFAAFARVTSCSHQADSCRVEAEFDMLSLGDGDMVELDQMCRPCICMDENDHERLDLDEECEVGHMLHLIGEARVKSVDDRQWDGKSLTLQIVEMAVEDETEEAEALA